MSSLVQLTRVVVFVLFMAAVAVAAFALSAIIFALAFAQGSGWWESLLVPLFGAAALIAVLGALAAIIALHDRAMVVIAQLESRAPREPPPPRGPWRRGAVPLAIGLAALCGVAAALFGTSFPTAEPTDEAPYGSPP